MDGLMIFTYPVTMTGFLIKKAFCDLWDNMFLIVLLNLGFIASLAIPLLLPRIIPVPALSAAVLAVGIIWLFLYLAAAALSVKAISDYGSFGFSDFGENVKAGWPAGLVMGLICLVLYAMVTIIIPFYLHIESPVGLFLAAAIFWTFALSLASFQFFFAIRARLGTKPLKVTKKCFIIFFDNPGFSVFCLFYSLVMLVVSGLLAFLFPGPAGILLFLDEALRLRLLKYDWLEANPDTNTPYRKRKIPWNTILVEEREKTGTRSFRSFIFPWKD